MSRTEITFEIPLTVTMTVVDNTANPLPVEQLLAHRLNAAAGDITESLHVEDLDYELANAEAVSTADATDPRAITE